MDGHSRLAAGWVRRFEALRGADLRVAYARHELARLTPDTFIELLSALSAGAEAGAAGHRELLQTVFVALADPRLRELRLETVERAAGVGEAAIAALLAVPPAAPTGPASAREAAPREGPGRPLTLGERKSLARTRDRHALARALRDPHHEVIRILLGNPALTEDDVVRLCAARPCAPEALREVFQRSRWSSRTRVRLALVKNPSCPLDIAVQIAWQLKGAEAREVADAADLRLEVRRAALRAHLGRTLH